MASHSSVPTVMSFAGLDPSGGAGIQADIEALVSHGCHCAPVITALTVQDTANVHAYQAVDPALVLQQARAVLADLRVKAFKIGLLGSVEIIRTVALILAEHPHLPVVLDPILRAGGGHRLADADMQTALSTLLLPHTTLLTPNLPEIRALAPEADTPAACAMALLDRGCEFVLLTGGHADDTPQIVNQLYGNRRQLETFHWERLPGAFHGSGCTLAASIAGLLAHDCDPLTAVHEAQEYTWESLKHAYAAGQGQLVPNRLFWAQADHEDG